jgi:glycosyltransferase involved in cell wall biosynthesis
MAARLEKVKGHMYAIDAFKNLPTDVKLLMAGDGSEEQNLRAAAQGMENCIFAGFIKEIHEIQNIADVMLNLSDTETTCAALLEGMSLGIPALVSNLGGSPYVVEHGVNGFIVPDREAETVSAAILELKNDRERYKNMSENCLRIYGERFTAQTMTSAVEREYVELYS